ncbi:type IV pilus biogenesis protein PilM [Oceanobacillus halophilus]|uniref:Pilus assembly protein PilM n=1 Tax=Oceanobacillus halophilus TaxID=930130 RepID=A0A494ZUL4_9BACI|nr:pilus assembly protein PilM [Oceanobacillus halophilus]RKQ29890.1 pilus assembly protein PilM [Oceanobacillus halophilus]
MGFMNNGRVNMVITNYVLRYSYHKTNTLDSLVEHGEIEIPTDTVKDGKLVNKAVLTEVINQLLHKHKWKRKKLFFATPDDTVVIRKIQIPISLTKEEAKSYIRTQIGNQVYLPFANPSIDIELLDADETNQNVLLFAYPKEKLLEYSDAFESAGLKPMAADLTSLSVYRYYYHVISKEKDHVLLVHWNKDALILTVFQNHKAIFTRHLKTSSIPDEVNEEVLSQHVGEYVIEINRIIDFYRYSITKGQFQINQLLLSGDFPHLSKVKERLSEQVEIPIESFDQEELQAKYVDVLGLALKKDV